MLTLGAGDLAQWLSANYLDTKHFVVARTYIVLVDFLRTTPHSNSVPPKNLSVSCVQLPNARITGAPPLRALSLFRFASAPNSYSARRLTSLGG